MEHEIQVLGFSTVVEDIPDLIGKVYDVTSNLNGTTSNSCVIQLLNADGVAGEEHVLHAAEQAIIAFKRKENIANDLGLEICVRASAQRQISKALQILGLKEGLNNICAVIVDCDEGAGKKLELLLGKRDDTLLKADTTHLKDLYQISDEEIENSGGIARTMIERTSLLILEA
jgi:KEOPS complex subunit Cgi121